MCCFNNFAPGPGATKIADLKPGDLIRLLPNFGDPASDKSRALFVIDVDGYSALCHDGTTLAGIRNDGEGFEVICHVPIEEVVVNESAQTTLLQAALRREEAERLANEWMASLNDDLIEP
ncbi:hypothetical protein HYU91_00145 [Candidatus Collierbacteria bacterium]|nr:hypothetical protein [Candidatus Collierbacteria bacterium]